MAAFTDLDWSRFDVWAIVGMGGVAVVKTEQRKACLDWLKLHGYSISSIDFAQGVGAAIVALGELFHWEQQFGYRLTPESHNLNALRDGFEFEMRPRQGRVLELLNADVAYGEEPGWNSGLLSISHEYSRRQLAIGNCFFVTPFLDDGSPLVGKPFKTLTVPAPYWTPADHGNPFAS